jgi:hypothetical protein
MYLVSQACKGRKIRREDKKKGEGNRNPVWREGQMKKDSRNQCRRPISRKTSWAWWQTF